VILVRGKDGWRLSGAVLSTNLFSALPPEARVRAGRVAQLLLRLVQGETKDPELFAIFRAFLTTLPTLTEDEADAAETIAVLCALGVLGLDAGEMPEGANRFTRLALQAVVANRQAFIRRVNHGIASSGL
jgi:hypothetical protein